MPRKVVGWEGFGVKDLGNPLQNPKPQAQNLTGPEKVTTPPTRKNNPARLCSYPKASVAIPRLL